MCHASCAWVPIRRYWGGTTSQGLNILAQYNTRVEFTVFPKKCCNCLIKETGKAIMEKVNGAIYICTIARCIIFSAGMAWCVILHTMLYQHAVTKRDCDHGFLKSQRPLHGIGVNSLHTHVRPHSHLTVTWFHGLLRRKMPIVTIEVWKQKRTGTAFTYVPLPVRFSFLTIHT